VAVSTTRILGLEFGTLRAIYRQLAIGMRSARPHLRRQHPGRADASRTTSNRRGGEIDDANLRVNRDLAELCNLVDYAGLIVRSALQRHESRGLH
jgi:aspartate oxidase